MLCFLRLNRPPNYGLVCDAPGDTCYCPERPGSRSAECRFRDERSAGPDLRTRRERVGLIKNLSVYPSISAMSVDGLTPRVRAISMNSRTLICRSPASSFQTNEFDLFSFAASCRCVRPAALRAALIAEMSARCFALRSCFNLVPRNWMHPS